MILEFTSREWDEDGHRKFNLDGHAFIIWLCMNTKRTRKASETYWRTYWRHSRDGSGLATEATSFSWSLEPKYAGSIQRLTLVAIVPVLLLLDLDAYSLKQCISQQRGRHYRQSCTLRLLNFNVQKYVTTWWDDKFHYEPPTYSILFFTKEVLRVHLRRCETILFGTRKEQPNVNLREISTDSNEVAIFKLWNDLSILLKKDDCLVFRVQP